MLVKILGVFDIIVAIIYVLSYLFHIIPDAWLFFSAIYLGIKGAIFLLTADIASGLDVICAIIIYFSMYGDAPILLSAFVAFYLLQKGFISIIA